MRHSAGDSELHLQGFVVIIDGDGKPLDLSDQD